MTVRSSGGLDAVYSNFSVSPVSASAGFSLNDGVVTVDAGQAVPVDGIIDFGGVEVTEISFDISQNASTTHINNCLLYTSPSPRDQRGSRMPSSA